MSGLSIQGIHEQPAKKQKIQKEGERVMEQIQSLTEVGMKPFFLLWETTFPTALFSFFITNTCSFCGHVICLRSCSLWQGVEVVGKAVGLCS